MVMIGETVTLAAATSMVYVRAWIRVSQLPVGTNAMEVINAEQNGGAGIFAFVRATDTTVYSGFDLRAASGGTAVPTNTWVCLLWTVARSTTATGSRRRSPARGTRAPPAS